MSVFDQEALPWRVEARLVTPQLDLTPQLELSLVDQVDLARIFELGVNLAPEDADGQTITVQLTLLRN